MSKIRFLTYLLIFVIFILSRGRHGYLEAPLAAPPIGWSPELSSWAGHSEEWIKSAIPQAELKRESLIGPSNWTLDYRIEAQLAKEAVGYSDSIKQLEFVEVFPGWRSRHYRVYLFRRNGIWTILDVQSWERQMAG